MSYIPTEWKTGDIVTAEKLNKLEEGVASGGGGGGGLVRVPVTENPSMVYSLGKTFSELQTLVRAGYVPFITVPPWLNGDGYCDEQYVGVILQEGDVSIQSQYQIQFGKNGMTYLADGPDTTPVCDMS